MTRSSRKCTRSAVSLLEKHGGFEGFMQYIRECDAKRLQREKEEADR